MRLVGGRMRLIRMNALRFPASPGAAPGSKPARAAAQGLPDIARYVIGTHFEFSTTGLYGVL